MTKVKIAVFLIVLLVNASPLDAQGTRLEEKRAAPSKEVPGKRQREKQPTKAPKALGSSWQKLSDREIARMFFPNERLYFQENIKGLFKDPGAFDEIAVHEVKRLIANFDNDKESEMAVLLRYSYGECNQCAGRALFAILDEQQGKLRIPWKTKEHARFDEDGTADIWAVRLIQKDNFSQLVLKYNGLACSGCTHKGMSIVRWNGKQFTEIWSYDIEEYDHGGHTENPHNYVANVDFTRDDKLAKRIKVNSIYVTWPRAREPKQYQRYEEFAWSNEDQKYFAVAKREYKYEKNETCDSLWERGRRDQSLCYPLEPLHQVSYNRGLTYFKNGQYDEAISEFSKTLKTFTSGDVYFNRALAYFRKGQYDQAISDLTRATEMGMNAGLAEAYHFRGLAYLEKSEYEKAISDFNMALKANPKNNETYFYKGQAYEQAGLTKEAIEAYKTYIQNIYSGLPELVERAMKRTAELEKK